MQVSSVGIKLKPGEHMNLGQLQTWLGEIIEDHGKNLYRYKGIISVKGFEEKFVFQGVHEIFDGNFVSNWEQPEEQRVSKFVFIGKFKDHDKNEKLEVQKKDNLESRLFPTPKHLLTRKYLEEAFKDCIAKPLRFKIGDKVQAKMKGGWHTGTVVKQWDMGNPYRIQVEETGKHVYGPKDDDRVVRAYQG